MWCRLAVSSRNRGRWNCSVCGWTRRLVPPVLLGGSSTRQLRQWFVCCAWQWNTLLGMPSRAVDEAWHELILDTRTYTAFCHAAFGRYLHHTPDEAMGTPMGDALAETVRAWDRSEMGRKEDSILWDLDEQLGWSSRWGSTASVSPPCAPMPAASPSRAGPMPGTSVPASSARPAAVANRVAVAVAVDAAEAEAAPAAAAVAAEAAVAEP